MTTTDSYRFSNNWFDLTAKKNWNLLFDKHKPKKYLEIGSFEGRSLCELIERNDWTPHLNCTAIDTFKGGREHSSMNLASLEQQFDENVKVALDRAINKCSVRKIVAKSEVALPGLINLGEINSFDFIYVDGSHEAPDVLFDAVNSMKLLKVGGILGFDDYTWNHTTSDITTTPKMAIDAFLLNFAGRYKFAISVLNQIYIQKIQN